MAHARHSGRASAHRSMHTGTTTYALTEARSVLYSPVWSTARPATAARRNWLSTAECSA
jgi:hypothetical protein